MSKSKLHNFFRLSATDMFYFFVALYFSVLYWICTRLLPYSVWKNILGTATKTGTPSLKEQEKSKFRTVIIAVNRCSRHVPFARNCLIKALTTRKILRMKGIKSTLCLGLNNENKKLLTAHAWVKIGPDLTIGESKNENFIVVVMYK
ncbi:MAG TPA: lasso peptide biosynthesis B2 protein [Bacteroidales bacterium]|nr:lasso peptide biosynthesis B2 protein [Bacteroidales bacterium]